MAAAPLHWQTIRQLSEQIHSGQLSPVELMEHLLDRVEALDDRLHAFRLVPRERAVAGAQAAELALRAGRDTGPLHGIPYAAKDIIDVQGLPTTAGSPLLEDTIADTDATVVRRLNQAGMVLLGKTYTVQFALGAPGVNHDHGTPHNPWHATHHVPGGSSSGSGVAVGAGLVPAALGTDTGGSVRIPAALCGTVGLKTTVGQVSRHGVFPLSWTLDSVGPLVRSVRTRASPIVIAEPDCGRSWYRTMSISYRTTPSCGLIWPENSTSPQPKARPLPKAPFQEQYSPSSCHTPSTPRHPGLDGIPQEVALEEPVIEPYVALRDHSPSVPRARDVFDAIDHQHRRQRQAGLVFGWGILDETPVGDRQNLLFGEVRPRLELLICHG